MNLLSENSENRFKYDEHLNQQINHKILDRDWDENDDQWAGRESVKLTFFDEKSLD